MKILTGLSPLKVLNSIFNFKAFSTIPYSLCQGNFSFLASSSGSSASSGGSPSLKAVDVLIFKLILKNFFTSSNWEIYPALLDAAPVPTPFDIDSNILLRVGFFVLSIAKIYS